MQLKELIMLLKLPGRIQGGISTRKQEIAIKIKIIFENLAKTKWLNPIPKFVANLAQINQMLFERFGGEGFYEKNGETQNLLIQSSLEIVRYIENWNHYYLVQRSS